jgi:hypothetical protein
VAIKQPGYFFSAWEDYEKWESTCPDCNWNGLLSFAIFDQETELISALLCPTCNRKLALMGNEATPNQIRTLAAQGSEKAMNHLKMRDNPPQ